MGEPKYSVGYSIGRFLLTIVILFSNFFGFLLTWFIDPQPVKVGSGN
jgi:hypothetical protein